MFDAILRIYKSTGNKKVVAAAVNKKGWITSEDYKLITGEDLPAQ